MTAILRSIAVKPKPPQNERLDVALDGLKWAVVTKKATTTYDSNRIVATFAWKGDADSFIALREGSYDVYEIREIV